MNYSYIEKVKNAGVVGVGGAGFPTHVKINNKALVVIANGAECEPLLCVDRQVMEKYAKEVLEGLMTVMNITQAERGVVRLKEKYTLAIQRISEEIESKKTSNINISIQVVGNYYPAGDEQQMVYEVTGNVVPLGGLPIDVGAIVLNVSTLFNVAKALRGEPVISKFVTIAGEINRPLTLNVPIGTSIKKLLELAKAPSDMSGYMLILGGPAMGYVEEDMDKTVTKTLGGVIILPKKHMLITKKTENLNNNYKLSKSVCCQCNFCTDMCPRNTLGLMVEPHKVMRAINYQDFEALGNATNVFGCCDCGLCTYYACNMGLSPHRMITALKVAMAKKGVFPQKVVPSKVNTFRDYRKVPEKRFLERLGLGKYSKDAPLETDLLEVDKVKIYLKQHIGESAIPIVKKGNMVKRGTLIGIVEEGKLGANVHSSIDGKVTDVTNVYIEICVY